LWVCERKALIFSPFSGDKRCLMLGTN